MIPAWMGDGSGILGFWTRAAGVGANGQPVITYGWYRSFIQFLIDSNSAVWFSKVIVAGELLVGLGLLFGGLVGIAAFFGALMNMSFLMAGTVSTNPVLFFARHPVDPGLEERRLHRHRPLPPPGAWHPLEAGDVRARRIVASPTPRRLAGQWRAALPQLAHPPTPGSGHRIFTHVTGRDVRAMLKTILLPLDGSTLSERALPYAGALARRSGGRVVLVEAVEVHPFLGVDLSESQIAVVDRAETNLRKAANRLDAEGIPAEPHTLLRRSGDGHPRRGQSPLRRPDRHVDARALGGWSDALRQRHRPGAAARDGASPGCAIDRRASLVRLTGRCRC